jgi:hypothetical protein
MCLTYGIIKIVHSESFVFNVSGSTMFIFSVSFHTSH